MTEKTVALVRHGHSQHNPERGAFLGGLSWLSKLFHPDTCLTDVGQQQAKDLHEQLTGDPKHPLNSVEVIITSPLSRCIQTTLLVFGDTGIPPRVVSAAHTERCVFPCDTGRSPEELVTSFPALRNYAGFGELSDVWWPQDRGILNEVHPVDRVDAFKRMLLQRDEEKIAVVGHSGFFKLLTGKKMDNCEVLWMRLCADASVQLLAEPPAEPLAESPVEPPVE
mmetsp:Transcript_6070/g.11089  ORF Transcript_6070/g.11089 Transcript_6070/m.11089 type:complete len:223 (+) Transcript_6070:1-669(+)